MKKIRGRKKEMGGGAPSGVMSTTQETPFRLTFNIVAVILVEVEEPSSRTTVFHQAKNEDEIRTNLDLL
ncbi:hypothetical protein CR513_55160, partial [Mucuna pruriens]